MKKMLTCISILALTFITTEFVYAYEIVGLGNFQKDNEYVDGTFSDVSSVDWFYENVSEVYEYGLMNGRDVAVFAANDDITLAESVTLAVRMNDIYYWGDTYLDNNYENEVWYAPYVQSAKVSGILTTDYPDYDAPATRAQFAAISAASVDPAEFTENEINWIDDGAIPDVPMEAEYAGAVYMLYRAGILTGSDESGAFNPNDSITRAEAAAIITRIVDPSLRKSLDLYGEY